MTHGFFQPNGRTIWLARKSAGRLAANRKRMLQDIAECEAAGISLFDGLMRGCDAEDDAEERLAAMGTAR